MSKGIYCLVVFVASPKTIRIGALGNIDFEKGYYLYVGSALGSGGLSRLDRHIRFSEEKYMKPKWHIDYLDSQVPIVAAFSAETEEPLECVLAERIGGPFVRKFGCSDCGCESHLFYRKTNPFEEIEGAFTSLGLCVKKRSMRD